MPSDVCSFGRRNTVRPDRCPRQRRTSVSAGRGRCWSGVRPGRWPGPRAGRGRDPADSWPSGHAGRRRLGSRELAPVSARSRARRSPGRGRRCPAPGRPADVVWAAPLPSTPPRSARWPPWPPATRRPPRTPSRRPRGEIASTAGTAAGGRDRGGGRFGRFGEPPGQHGSKDRGVFGVFARAGARLGHIAEQVRLRRLRLCIWRRQRLVSLRGPERIGLRDRRWSDRRWCDRW